MQPPGFILLIVNNTLYLLCRDCEDWYVTIWEHLHTRPAAECNALRAPGRSKVTPFINDTILAQYQLKTLEIDMRWCSMGEANSSINPPSLPGNVTGIKELLKSAVMSVNQTETEQSCYNCFAIPVMSHCIVCVIAYCLFIVKSLVKTASIRDHWFVRMTMWAWPPPMATTRHEIQACTQREVKGCA